MGQGAADDRGGDRATLRAMLADFGATLGAEPTSLGFVLHRADVQVVAAISDEGTLSLQATSEHHGGAQPLRRQGPSYRAAAAPAVDAIPVYTVEPILLRPLENIDHLPFILGLRQVQIDDEAFDVSVTIETAADTAVARRVLTEPKIRAAVFQLLDAGCERVTLYAGAVTASAERFGIRFLEPASDQEMMRRRVEAILDLAAALPLLAPKRAGSIAWRRHALSWLWLGLLVPGAVLAAVMLSVWHSFGAWPLLGILVGLALWLLVLPAVAWRVRKRANPWRAAVRILLPCLVALPLLALDALLATNCGLDRSPVDARPWPVLGMRVVPGDQDSFAITIPLVPTDTEGEAYELDVSEELFRQLEQRPEDARAVTIAAHPGRLGFGWYGAVEVAP